MISYHPGKCSFVGSHYAQGFKPLMTKNYDFLAKVMRRYAWSPIVFEGGIRKTQHFIEAHFIGLDFDEGLSLQQAVENIFCDVACIIGTTRSHLKPKHGVIADRFRILIELEEPITNAEHYKEKIQIYSDKYGHDTSAKDAARFFWPCNNIVFMNPGGYKEDLSVPQKNPQPYRPPPLKRREEMQKRHRLRGLSGWLREFVTKGVLPHFTASRNRACNAAALDLLYLGYNPIEIKRILVKAPFVKKGFADSEYESTIQSAIKFHKKIMKEEEEKHDRRDKW